MSNVIIIGAGKNSKVVADIVLKRNDVLLGFLDDNKTGKIIGDYEVIGKINDCLKFASQAKFIISIGDNKIRKAIAEKFDLNWYTAIHPSAQIGFDVNIDCGTMIMANAVINPSAKIGKHCIINTATVVEHDDTIGDYVHLSPNSALCGTVVVGDNVHIGAGATVINNISICDSSIIGAGATVINDITEQGVYVGVPARKNIKVI